jgi:hypothetical protein
VRDSEGEVPEEASEDRWREGFLVSAPAAGRDLISRFWVGASGCASLAGFAMRLSSGDLSDPEKICSKPVSVPAGRSVGNAGWELVSPRYDDDVLVFVNRSTPGISFPRFLFVCVAVA